VGGCRRGLRRRGRGRELGGLGLCGLRRRLERGDGAAVETLLRPQRREEAGALRPGALERRGGPGRLLLERRQRVAARLARPRAGGPPRGAGPERPVPEGAGAAPGRRKPASERRGDGGCRGGGASQAGSPAPAVRTPGWRVGAATGRYREEEPGGQREGRNAP